MTLTEFILARIAEDETRARGQLSDQPPTSSDVVGVWLGSRWHPTTDPARVLAECEAKRRIVEWSFAHMVIVDGEWGCVHSAEEIRSGACEFLNPDEDGVLRALAAVYADHPEYRQEWRP